MPLYRPTDLRDFLESIGRCPKKSLSQNFLIDGNIIRKIVKTANIVPGDIVLEIGPGPGSLTEMLLEAGAKVIAVERDDDLALALKRLGTEQQLTVINEDIITFLDEARIDTLVSSGIKIKVVANLPYHLTTPIVTRLVQMPDRYSSLTLMVQDEVARRFSAEPCSKEYGSLTLFLRYYSRCQYAFRVGRNCFYPAPKVDSAIVHFDLGPTAYVSDTEGFFNLTQMAFRQRRKMLRSSLREFRTPHEIEAALSAVGLSVNSRPEELDLQQFIAFFEQVSKT